MNVRFVGSSDTIRRNLALFELAEVPVHLPEHPDRERELEVGIRDRAALVEHAFDGFLSPRTVLCGARDQRTIDEHDERETHRKLSVHDQLDTSLYRLRVRILGVHESHNRPTSLYDLRVFMLYPLVPLARLSIRKSGEAKEKYEEYRLT